MGDLLGAFVHHALLSNLCRRCVSPAFSRLSKIRSRFVVRLCHLFRAFSFLSFCRNIHDSRHTRPATMFPSESEGPSWACGLFFLLSTPLSRAAFQIPCKIKQTNSHCRDILYGTTEKKNVIAAPCSEVFAENGRNVLNQLCLPDPFPFECLRSLFTIRPCKDFTLILTCPYNDHYLCTSKCLWSLYDPKPKVAGSI